MASDISVGDDRAAPPVGEGAVAAAIQSASGQPALGPGLAHRRLVGFMLAHEQFTVPQLADFATLAAGAGFRSRSRTLATTPARRTLSSRP